MSRGRVELLSGGEWSELIHGNGMREPAGGSADKERKNEWRVCQQCAASLCSQFACALCVNN